MKTRIKLFKEKRIIDGGRIKVIICGEGKSKSAATRQLNRKVRMIEAAIDANTGSIRC